MSRVYLDTNIFVYAFEGNQTFGPPARAILQSIQSKDHLLFGSLITLSELLVLPAREGNTFYTARLKLFFRSPGITLVPYTPEAADLYAELRAIHRVKPLDAYHLASAAIAGMDFFITNDVKLTQLTVPGIARIEGLETQL
jgi:predicted nucleic acid-binding protein